MLTPGILFALIFIAYTVIRAIRGRTGATWLHLVLGLLVIAAFVMNSMNSQASSVILAAAAAGALVIAGIVILVIERRRNTLSWNQSQGVLSVAIGGMVLVTVLVGPLLNGLVITPPFETLVSAGEEPVEVAAALPSPTPTIAVNPTGVAFVPTNTLAPTIPPVQVDAASAEVIALLPTRFIYTTPVPTATSESVAIACEGRVQTYLNMRSNPSVETLVVASMPPYTTVTVHGRNTDATWLQIEYDGVIGWASADFVNLDEACQELPVQIGL